MTSAAAGEHRILLVDGDPDTRAICQTVLEHAGYRVWAVADGSEGHQLARKVRPDVVICESRACMADGVPLPQAIRAEPFGAQARMLVVTSRALPDELAEVRTWGADRILIKPISPAHLLSEIAGLLAVDADAASPDG